MSCLKNFPFFLIFSGSILQTEGTITDPDAQQPAKKEPQTYITIRDRQGKAWSLENMLNGPEMTKEGNKYIL